MKIGSGIEQSLQMQVFIFYVYLYHGILIYSNQKNNLNRQKKQSTFQIITRALKEKTNSEWDKIFGGEGESSTLNTKGKRAKFPYGPVNNLSQVFQDTQVKHNKMEIDMDHKNVGKIKQVPNNSMSSILLDISEYRNCCVEYHNINTFFFLKTGCSCSEI